jgi:hypothetical protein
MGIITAAASCLSDKRHRRWSGESRRKERQRRKKGQCLRAIFASPYEALIMRNKPELGQTRESGERRVKQAHGAKQTQFSGGRDAPTIPLFHYSGIPIRS